ncbi:hypothetical protein BH09GEM1_BH09GEM1_07270 [soil metagenome]
MPRFVYQPDRDGNIPTGPYNQLAGVRIKRGQAERILRTLYRSDGSIAGTEDRQTLVIDTDGSSGPMMTGSQADRLASPLWRLLYSIRQLFYVLLGTGFLTIGSALVLSITQDLTHSVGLSLIAVAAFWGVCYGISTQS